MLTKNVSYMARTLVWPNMAIRNYNYYVKRLLEPYT